MAWPDEEPDPKETKLKKEILFKGDTSFLDWYYDVKAELQDFGLAHHIREEDGASPPGVDEIGRAHV